MAFSYLGKYLIVPRSEVNVLVEKERNEEKDEERRWRERLTKGKELFVIYKNKESFITTMLTRSITSYLYRDSDGLLS